MGVNQMSEELRKYINEWNAEQAKPETAETSFQKKDRELYSIQNEIRRLYEQEKESLTEEESQEAEKILSVDLTYFL